MVIVFICLYVAAYLLGSIPNAVWIGKRFYGIDVREHGSRNAGSTNTFRVLGYKPGLVVFAMDVLKGFLSVELSLFFPDLVKGEILELAKIGLGVAAVIGHIFPIFAGFRGGKGVATMLGIVFGLHIYAALSALSLWIASFAVSRIVSMSSILAGLFFPIAIFFIFDENSLSVQIFSLLTALVLLITHRKNISRLLSGTEPKLNLKPQK
jgi:glycerol-3-phosphate acyltransferase PlsY